MTGRDTGATSREFGGYVIETVKDPGLEKKWQSYQ
jgi:hypothetical protein